MAEGEGQDRIPEASTGQLGEFPRAGLGLRAGPAGRGMLCGPRSSHC